ncbi:cyanophycinase [Rhodovibrio sodomensis]|uniref:Cyanophycinase n=1 Tax=Rhodovibrio sodomensis TaxID=1088 RepID=A0ABS1DLC5_9PROT|nr:cyanophycinase [Rhodovibrio sodomensis]MBK1671340.1 cyanophycinase [Rhodovibrio sodomensis]
MDNSDFTTAVAANGSGPKNIGDEPLGTLIAIGGAEDKTSNLEVLTRVFAHAPEDNKTVAVIATASQIPEEVLPAYAEVFKRLGATEVHSLDVPERAAAKSQKTCEAVRNAGVIFFTGGDQLRLTYVLGGSPLLQVVRERYQEGAVLAGTSAGAVALSSTMIYNGSAADALRKGAVKMSNGLGFVDGVVIDSHFLERGRFTRLMEVGATNPEYLGLGLGEDAGVIFHNGGFLEAIGPGHVVIVDSRDLGSSNVADLSDGEPVAVENVIMHALIAGHGYDRTTRTYLGADTLAQRFGERTKA